MLEKTKSNSTKQFIEIFRLVSNNQTSKEAIPEIVIWLSKHKNKNPLDAIVALNLIMIPKEQLRSIISNIIDKNFMLVKNRKDASQGILMGIIMKQYRGKVDANLVSSILKEEIMKTKNSIPKKRKDIKDSEIF